MKYVHELRRYQMLMNGINRAALAADSMHYSGLSRACEYDDKCEALFEKAQNVKPYLRKLRM